MPSMKKEGINGTSAPITLLKYQDLEEIMNSPATSLSLSPNLGRRKLNELFVNQHLPVIQMKQTAVFPPYKQKFGRRSSFGCSNLRWANQFILLPAAI
jgi:hypothetical protein